MAYSVVFRSTSKSQVALICGGGSGHEPSHAGFVGKTSKDILEFYAEICPQEKDFLQVGEESRYLGGHIYCVLQLLLLAMYLHLQMSVRS